MLGRQRGSWIEKQLGYLYHFPCGVHEGRSVCSVLGTSEATIGGELQKESLSYKCIMSMSTKTGYVSVGDTFSPHWI